MTQTGPSKLTTALLQWALMIERRLTRIEQTLGIPPERPDDAQP